MSRIDYINHKPVRDLKFKSACRENYDKQPEEYALHNVYWGLYELFMENVKLSDDVNIAVNINVQKNINEQCFIGRIETIPIQETVIHVATDDNQIKYNGYPKKLTWKQRINILFKGEI